MALLTLNNIGKIYVSDGNVAVGIRGVDLSFERGEFVAITGQSGSGKSTLLNVISGMDSYEEGEMYIEGEPTSHFLQPEWEKYREKYISFIFQDYNIIESFTVLENVELALMHIEDKKERRRRALELIRRVGLSSQVKQKGSKLSGGQKQRTVIARALAKDSPIILADEPTGNLDSATSAEIIELLREVSRDKLLIVVTHNFEQVEAYATRHVRVFDGAIESDHVLRQAPTVAAAPVSSAAPQRARKSKDVRNGLTLGVSVFKAKPKLSFFLCMLMIVGTLGIFLVTSFCGEAADAFEKKYMFEPIEGRVVLTKQSGEVLTEDEIERIAREYGASEYLRYDMLLDEGSRIDMSIVGSGKSESFVCTYGEDFGDDISGSYPTKENEVLLYLPISYKKLFDGRSSELGYLNMQNVYLKITGVKYYVDNNLTPRCLFTAEGFRTATAVFYLLSNGSSNISVNVYSTNGSFNEHKSFFEFLPSYEVESGKIYVDSKELSQYMAMPDTQVEVIFNAQYYNYNWNSTNSESMMNFNRVFDKSAIAAKGPADMTVTSEDGYQRSYQVAINPLMMREIAEDVLSRSYRQASFFFEDNEAARSAAEALCDNGYIAVPADTTYTPDPIETLLGMISSVIMIAVWGLAIIFLAFFINLCSGRTIGAFKGDMAIMRSMGIPVKVVRIGIYVRMLLSLIPAYILVIATAVMIFTVPSFNALFTYLYPWQYALIFIGMLLLTVRITHKQIRKLFGESVKKSLKGGAAND